MNRATLSQYSILVMVAPTYGIPALRTLHVRTALSLKQLWASKWVPDQPALQSKNLSQTLYMYIKISIHMYTHTLPIIHTLSIVYFLPETIVYCHAFQVSLCKLKISLSLTKYTPHLLYPYSIYILGDTRTLVCSFKDFPLCKRIQSPAAAHFQSFSISKMLQGLLPTL